VIAMISHIPEAGRNDLVILDTTDLAAGPMASVKLPFKAMAQVHGCRSGNSRRCRWG
jgi:carotenoid cleavage dioxygenase